MGYLNSYYGASLIRIPPSKILLYSRCGSILHKHVNSLCISDCERISIFNGTVIFPTGTKYNAVADVECHDGYRINGSDTLTCLSSGMWPTDSECIPKG